MKISWQNPVVRFLSIAFGLLVLWYLIYELWLHPIGAIDIWVIDNLTYLSAQLLELMGYDLIEDSYPDMRTLGVDGGHLLWIGDPCNGLNLFALFTGFVIAYPGPWKKKIWYIPVGILSIHLLNVLRIAGLCILVKYSPDSLEFNHTYTFQLIVYGYVFVLWYIWAVRLSNVKLYHA